MRITDYPDLLRTKGKEPMPQAWDETNQDWTPAIDSAATLKALREALGAPADATQADPVQEATAIALLKGLLELTAKRATELFGASLSDRPPANSVSVGTTFMVVGDTVVYQSNGTDWVVISE